MIVSFRDDWLRDFFVEDFEAAIDRLAEANLFLLADRRD